MEMTASVYSETDGTDKHSSLKKTFLNFIISSIVVYMTLGQTFLKWI